MEQDRQNQSTTQIAVMEKDTQEQTAKLSSKELAAQRLNLFSADVMKDFKYHTENQKKILENKSESEKQITPLVPNAPQAPKPLTNKVAFAENSIKQVEEKEEEQQITEPTEEIEEQTLASQVEEQEIEEQALFGEIEKIESTNNEELEEEINASVKTKSKGFSFRMRLCTGVMCLLIALFGGWIIGNAIEIASTSAQIAETEVVKDTYEANLVSYLQKISQLDNWNENNVNSDASLIPIEEIIPITPTPLEDPTSYERESNWFDKICNWFSNLFGG